MNTNLHCNTIAQYKAYKWIKKHFDISYLTLELVDDKTIKMIDSNDKSARISYVNNTITIEYSDGNREIFPTKRINGAVTSK
ncbi:hypothetical protein [Longibaculum muris]|uniref:hypothetical protein n=1 Tax=Longibaculum muris TaxID=1796628 RepID=UPI0012B9F309|nr:hypothetical protein [Longibaculum muris]